MDNFREPHIFPVEPEGGWPFNLGYTTVQKRWRWHKAQLARHRKKRWAWEGTKQAWGAEEARQLERITVYRDLLAQPFYSKKVREAANRKRRVKRPLLVKRTVMIEQVSPWAGRIVVEDEHLAHLPYMVLRIKKKRFKTMQHLSHIYRKPLSWLREAKDKAIERGLITADEWRASFRQPGRPRKGAKRGHYKKEPTEDLV